MERIASLVITGIGSVLVIFGLLWRLSLVTIEKKVKDNQNWHAWVNLSYIEKGLIGGIDIEATNPEDFEKVMMEVPNLIKKGLKKVKK